MAKQPPSRQTQPTALMSKPSQGSGNWEAGQKVFPSARKIDKLCWAVPIPSKPSFIQSKRKGLKGAKAQGVSYEKKIKKLLEQEWPEVDFNYHKWFSFRRELDGKTEFCEPEMFLVFQDFILLLECKRTGCKYGMEQMRDFYAPILRHVYKRPVRCLQICKHVSVETPGPWVSGLREFLTTTYPYATWHNLGV
jgi:hypothetical protein